MGRRMGHLEIQKVGFPAFPGRTVARAWHGRVVRPGRLSGYPHANHHHSLNQGGEKNKIKPKLQPPAARHALEVGNDAGGLYLFFSPPFFCSPSGQCQAAPGGECPNFGTVVGGGPALPGAAPARAPRTPSPLSEPGRAVPGTHPLRGLRGEDRRGRRPGERGLGGERGRGGGEEAAGGTRGGGI